jgi:hypothetical protein
MALVPSRLETFDLDDRIGWGGENRGGDFFLAPHGVKGDHGSPQVQGFDQVRDGGISLDLCAVLSWPNTRRSSETQAPTG